MNKYLHLVRDFHGRLGIEPPDSLEKPHLSDMDIVMYQALLMDHGSATLKAIASGDLVHMLAGLVDLAYSALEPITARGDDVIATSVVWRQDGSVLSVMRVLCNKIDHCSTGETLEYSELFNICEQLSRGFINADFDTAFQIVHQHLMRQPLLAEADQNYVARILRARRLVPPDLSDALYE